MFDAASNMQRPDPDSARSPHSIRGPHPRSYQPWRAAYPEDSDLLRLHREVRSLEPRRPLHLRHRWSDQKQLLLRVQKCAFQGSSPKPDGTMLLPWPNHLARNNRTQACYKTMPTMDPRMWRAIAMVLPVQDLLQ